MCARASAFASLKRELMLYVVVHKLCEIQGPRDAVNQSNVVDSKALLESCVFEQLVQHHLRNPVTLEFDDDPGPQTIGLVADIRNPRDLLGVDDLSCLETPDRGSRRQQLRCGPYESRQHRSLHASLWTLAPSSERHGFPCSQQ